MKIPLLRSLRRGARAPAPPAAPPRLASVPTIAGFAGNPVAGAFESRSRSRVQTAGEPPGHPEPDASGCSCRERPTEQSGEVWSRGGRAGRETRLAPARPLTGFFPRAGHAPPTVIVSDLLSGLDVQVMLLEPDEAPPVSAPRTPPGEPVEAAPSPDQPRRPIFRPPVRVRFDPLRRLSRPAR
jgi:hypothetical protein